MFRPMVKMIGQSYSAPVAHAKITCQRRVECMMSSYMVMIKRPELYGPRLIR